MERFSPDQLVRFLRAVDEALTDAATITMIGGSALALGYGVEIFTNDIDTYRSNLEPLRPAIENACGRTGLRIPFANASIAQLPPGFEERARRILPELVRLEVWAIDPYDLAASKLLRGNAHDREQLADLHDLTPLDRPTLVARFTELIEIQVGDAQEPKWALVHLVEELWGELDGLAVRRLLGLPTS